MREKRQLQENMFDAYANHEIGEELGLISKILDNHVEILDWVENDIQPNSLKDSSGRNAMSIESVFRCAILKDHRKLSYEGLAFALLDSISCGAFARLPLTFVPKKSTLHAVISQIKDTTWEYFNKLLLGDAKDKKIEKGDMLRIDSTATETNIHTPTDSNLLWDSVRVIARLLKEAQEMGAIFEYRNHERVAKKRARAIRYTRGADKQHDLYVDLIHYTRRSLEYLEEAKLGMSIASVAGDMSWFAEVLHYTPLIQNVISQTERRIVNGESVPASEKIFSIFEEHTDIIIKAKREKVFGHKLNLSTGRSGMVLDIVIESGNPADSDRFIPMLDRHIANYGIVPKQVAADGGYASCDNLSDAKERGVKDTAFHKKRGLAVQDMVKSDWVYRKLRNFRAGIEASVSYLKRCFGLSRCNWSGLEHFKSYIWSSVVTHNLVLMARLQSA